jgi:hypothetical protein
MPGTMLLAEFTKSTAKGHTAELGPQPQRFPRRRVLDAHAVMLGVLTHPCLPRPDCVSYPPAPRETALTGVLASPGRGGLVGCGPERSPGRSRVRSCAPPSGASAGSVTLVLEALSGPIPDSSGA